MLKIGSLFSGIGGLELGLEWAGLGKTVWQVEKNEFCREVLAKHWPGIPIYKDVEQVGKRNLVPVDLLCGGFPCQDISSATRGKGKGLAGSKSGLWFQFHRIIEEINPRWVVIENVALGADRWVDEVVSSVEKLGYEALPIPLSAGDVGAPHSRPRIFVVAYTNRDWQPTEPFYEKMESLPESPRLDPWRGGRVPFSPICRMGDGITRRVDRLRALGNAVVPQCSEVIGHFIKQVEKNG